MHFASLGLFLIIVFIAIREDICRITFICILAQTLLFKLIINIIKQSKKSQICVYNYKISIHPYIFILHTTSVARQSSTFILYIKDNQNKSKELKITDVK